MLLKLILIVGVFAAIYFYFFKKKPISDTTNSSVKKDEKKSSDMVECSNCGIYCELDDAILSVSKYYCSNECLKSVK